MSNFISTGFSFNGETSNTHNAILIKVSDEGMSNMPVGAGRSPIEEWIVNRTQPFYYKSKFEVRNLTITIGLNTACTPTLTWTTAIKSEIHTWLYGTLGYKDFSSEDSNYTIIDKILFTSPLELMSADLYSGYITLNAVALPHRYTALQTTTANIVSNPTTVSITSLQTAPNVDGTTYYYPTIVATVGSSGAIKITNTSDSSRVFELTSLTAGETVTINNELKIVTGTVSTNLVSKLTNHNWFRLKAGVNSLSVTTLGSLTVTAQYPILG